MKNVKSIKKNNCSLLNWVRARYVTCFITSYGRLAICNRHSYYSSWHNVALLLKIKSKEGIKYDYNSKKSS